MMKCRECKGRIVLAPEGYYVCENCGLIDDRLVSYSTERETVNRAKDWMVGSYLFVYDGSDPAALRERRKNIEVTYTSKNLALIRARDALKHLSSILGLPNSACDNIFGTLTKLMEKWRENTSLPYSLNGLMAALIYVELQRRGRYISSKELVAAFKLAGKRLSYSDFLYGMHFLRKEGYVRYETRESGFKYIASLLRRCGIDAATISSMRGSIEEMMRRAEKIPGIRRRSAYSAIAYIVASSVAKMSYREFSRRTGVPHSTLRENTIRVRHHLDGSLLIRKA